MDGDEPTQSNEIYTPDCYDVRFSDGDECPHCHSTNTERIDTICDDPIIWACQCGSCAETFEILTGWADEED